VHASIAIERNAHCGISIHWLRQQLADIRWLIEPGVCGNTGSGLQQCSEVIAALRGKHGQSRSVVALHDCLLPLAMVPRVDAGHRPAVLPSFAVAQIASSQLQATDAPAHWPAIVRR
jgi:hypothetical protein